MTTQTSGNGDIDEYNKGFLAGYAKAAKKLGRLEKLHRRLINQLPNNEHEGRLMEMEGSLSEQH